MEAASARADNVVFRLVMLHSLDIEDLWFLIVGPLNAVLETQSALARSCAPRLPPSTRC
jgi:hypothetical protein